MLKGKNMMQDFKACFPPKLIRDPNATQPEGILLYQVIFVSLFLFCLLFVLFFD
jgi:hypothetical protein